MNTSAEGLTRIDGSARLGAAVGACRHRDTMRARLGALLPADTVARLVADLPDDHREITRRLTERAADFGIGSDGLARLLEEGGAVAEPVPPGIHGGHVPFFWPNQALDYVPPPMLVQKLLPRIGLALIRGPSNSGKTALAFDLAGSIGRGALWRGRRVGRGLVVYVAAENPGSAKLRMKGYVMKHDDAHTMSVAVLGEAINLLATKGIDRLIEQVQEAEALTGERCAAVFIDTLAACMPNADENSAADMGAAIAGMARLRDALNTLIVAVHHTGKDESRGARGSSALRAAVDVEIAVSGQTGVRTAEVVKQRDLPCGDCFSFTLEVVTVGQDREAGEAITTIVVNHGDGQPTRRRPTGKAQAAIINAMEADKRDRIWTRDELRIAANGAGVKHRNSIRGAIDKLVADGYLSPTTGGIRLA